MNNWIQTHSGIAFDLDYPTPDMVNVEDIAWALSNLCRFTGHVNEFYSVAQHSLLVSSKVPKRWRLAALLHDAPEAYIGDISAPLKWALTGGVPGMVSPLAAIESNIWRVITTKFLLPLCLPECVWVADTRMLMTEATQLLGKPPKKWQVPARPYKGMEIRPQVPTEAFEEFIFGLSDLGVSVP